MFFGQDPLGNIGGTSFNGVYVYSKDAIINDNIFVDNVVAIQVAPLSTYYSYRTKIRNNKFGVDELGNSIPNERCVIGFNAYDIDIQNNVFANSSQSAIYLWDCDTTFILENQIINNAENGLFIRYILTASINTKYIIYDFGPK